MTVNIQVKKKGYVFHSSSKLIVTKFFRATNPWWYKCSLTSAQEDPRYCRLSGRLPSNLSYSLFRNRWESFTKKAFDVILWLTTSCTIGNMSCLWRLGSPRCLHHLRWSVSIRKRNEIFSTTALTALWGGLEYLQGRSCDPEARGPLTLANSDKLCK